MSKTEVTTDPPVADSPLATLHDHLHAARIDALLLRDSAGECDAEILAAIACHAGKALRLTQALTDERGTIAAAQHDLNSLMQYAAKRGGK